MAGTWERTKFDDGAYQHYIKESTGALLYQLDPNRYYNCKECRPQQPGYVGTGVSISKKNTLVDVESELKNITRRQTRDPKGKYLPCKKQSPVALNNLPDCAPITDETRSTNPPCNLRGTGYSDHIFFNLCQNPQDLQAIEHPGRIHIDDKQMAKDNHKPILPNLINVVPSLPPGNITIKKPLCCPKDSNLECVFTDPLNKYYENKHLYPVHVQKALEYNYNKILDYHNKIYN
jgi:hypothetical protein